MRIRAVLLAGDRGASRSIGGWSKPFLEVGGKPMVVHVLETLLHTPEISEIFVVGDPLRLQQGLVDHGVLLLAAARACAVHVVPQRDTLYENVWHGFLRTVPVGDTDDGHEVLVLPADIPLMIPEEVSQFLQEASRVEADYVLGLTPEAALAPYAVHASQPGMGMAFFNLAEGRFRGNNLHLVRPLRIGNRHYIQSMYESRYQKEIGNVLRLGWQILVRELRNTWVLLYYLLMHAAGVLDRRGHPWASDRVRALVPLAVVERGLGALLRTRFRFVMTHLGGAALDVDNEPDLEVVEKMIGQWKAQQARLVRAA